MLIFNNVKSFYAKYEGRIGAATILLGFIFDNLTLRDASIHSQTIVFTIYLILAAISILALHFIEGRDVERKQNPKLHFWLFILMQFAIGSLFSMFLVFYSRGVSIASSWPFLLILVANMIGTEAWKSHYSRLSLQIAMLFVAVFSFCIYLVPIFIHRMNAYTFILSGFLAIIIILLFLRLLKRVSPERVKASQDRLALGVLVVYILMNILYFTDVIPPVPLVMKNGGVYHSLTQKDGHYIVDAEIKPWTEMLSPYPTFHYSQGGIIYIVTAVYAPSFLETEITHNWQYFDERANRWRSVTKIRVPIVGGREDGYRMYSVKQGVFAGLWRVDVETAEGQIVGRIRFKIVEDGATPASIQEVY